MSVTPFWLAGATGTGEQTLEVSAPYDGRPVGRAAVPTVDQVDHAIAAAADVADTLARLPAHARADALAGVSARIAERAEEFARLITAENGKPITWARGEVSRAVSTFRFGAEEARRWSGDLQRLDTDPGGRGRLAVSRRFPRGPVLGIAPFNFPLNLIAHKVAPAIAVGAPIVIKPAPATPLTGLLLGELLAETDLPPGAFSILPVPNERASALVADPRLPVVSFTGSGPVGWSIAESVPRKTVVLELGGNAAVVVLADYPDLEHAASRIATYSNYQAGQSCIAVQRVYVDRPAYQEFTDRLVAAVRALRVGDPDDDATAVGPMISKAAACRVEAWVAEATAAGARVLTGGRRDGAEYQPTVLVDVPDTAKVMREEVFGPVLAVVPVDGVDQAVDAVNASRYGLQAGVFTRDIEVAFRCHRDLRVGGVVIGDVPSYRADQMPYGGVKESGVGREGVRYAMEDLTESRVMVLTGLNL